MTSRNVFRVSCVVTLLLKEIHVVNYFQRLQIMYPAFLDCCSVCGVFLLDCCGKLKKYIDDIFNDKIQCTAITSVWWLKKLKMPEMSTIKPHSVPVVLLVVQMIIYNVKGVTVVTNR